MAAQFDLSMNGLMHRAFLRDFERSANAVRTDRWDAAVTRWTLVAGLLHQHHEHEDEHLWPAMLSRITDPADRAVVEAMETEHAALAEAIEACQKDFSGPRPTDGQGRASVVEHVERLAAVLAEHTSHEESQGEALIQRYVTPAEFKAFVKSARNTEYRMVVMPWIADGATPQDAAKAWGHIPGPVRLFLRPRMERKYLSVIVG